MHSCRCRFIKCWCRAVAEYAAFRRGFLVVGCSFSSLPATSARIVVPLVAVTGSLAGLVIVVVFSRVNVIRSPSVVRLSAARLRLVADACRVPSRRTCPHQGQEDAGRTLKGREGERLREAGQCFVSGRLSFIRCCCLCYRRHRGRGRRWISRFVGSLFMWLFDVDQGKGRMLGPWSDVRWRRNCLLDTSRLRLERAPLTNSTTRKQQSVLCRRFCTADGRGCIKRRSVVLLRCTTGSRRVYSMM